MKTISLCSWKGGTGKTSLTTAIVENLAKRGKNSLVIDLDSNLFITMIYNRLKVGDFYNSIELLNGNTNYKPVKLNTGFVNLIPSHVMIQRMNNISDRVLKFNLSKIDLSMFDYVFIDPPGAMNSLTRNAMIAADKIIIPAILSQDIEYECVKAIFSEMVQMGIEADISIVLNRYDEKRSVDNVENRYREDEELQPFLWDKKIPAMKSIVRLTSEVNQGYELKGKAKQIIDTLIEEVVL